MSTNPHCSGGAINYNNSSAPTLLDGDGVFCRSESCQCGRSLGRCPSCHLYTSFSLTKSRIFERNEYSCDSCGSHCTACTYRNRKYCYFWAGKSGSKWLHGCPNCPTPIPEGSEDNMSEYFKPFWNAIGPVLSDFVVELITRSKNKPDGNS